MNINIIKQGHLYKEFKLSDDITGKQLNIYYFNMKVHVSKNKNVTYKIK